MRFFSRKYIFSYLYKLLCKKQIAASYSLSWEQRKVSDLAEKTYGGGTPTTSNEAYWNGDIPWIQSSDVVDGKLLGVEPRKWITQDGLNNSAAQLIPGNSIAIITRVGVGKLAFMPYSYATSQDFLSLSKLNAEPLFTVYACYKKLQSELNAVQGTSIKGITKDELLAKNIMVPRYAEQQQIGAFFKQLDNLITLHQRKYDKLTNVKKSMLEKMFPKNGSNVPEIRFKGFTEAWEQRKLGDVAKYRNGKAHENDISEQGKFIVVNSKFVSTNGEVRKFSNKQIEPLFKNEIAFVLSDVPNGRAIARTFLVDKNDKYTLNQRIAGITPIEGTCPYFLHILMNRNKYFLQFDDGAKQTNLSVDDVIEFAEYYPSSEEQQQIGNFFRQLDNLITLHQRELEKLKNLKKACLEKMFV